MMWHRVAALLGGRSIVEWQRTMTHSEFVDWCAFYSLEPWGYDAANWRMGMVCATTANAGGRKRPLKPSDFIPKSGRRSRQQSASEIERTLREAANRGGTSNGD